MSYRKLLLVLLLQAGGISQAFALDSYRYLHVTVDTPWNIFLFLLIGIFAPFILMGILAWYFSFKKKPETKTLPSEDQP
jgi:hypothetical protein